MNEGTKFCIDCGKEIPTAAQFCPYCGSKQSALTGNANTQQRKVDSNIAEAASHSLSRQDPKQLWYKNWMVWAIIVLGVGLVTCIALLNSARTTVVMQPAASSKVNKKKNCCKEKGSKSGFIQSTNSSIQSRPVEKQSSSWKDFNVGLGNKAGHINFKRSPIS